MESDRVRHNAGKHFCFTNYTILCKKRKCVRILQSCRSGTNKGETAVVISDRNKDAANHKMIKIKTLLILVIADE